jgi:hypothetical protein
MALSRSKNSLVLSAVDAGFGALFAGPKNDLGNAKHHQRSAISRKSKSAWLPPYPAPGNSKRKRLGFFLPKPSDTWWRIDATTRPTAIAEEILDALVKLANPEMKKFMVDAHLRELWASGDAPGLTEVERLKCLSLLLKPTGAGSDALEGVKSALQRACDGGPSAAAIALHLSRLDELHKV